MAGRLIRHERRVMLSVTRAFPRQEMFGAVLADVGEIYLRFG